MRLYRLWFGSMVEDSLVSLCSVLALYVLTRCLQAEAPFYPMEVKLSLEAFQEYVLIKALTHLSSISGYSSHLREFQLSTWSSRIPSRRRSNGERSSQPRFKRSNHGFGVDSNQHSCVWWRQIQGEIRPPLLYASDHDIDAFQVTLFGESAGSISVSTLMLNENIAGSLFRAAVSISLFIIAPNFECRIKILESGVANSPLLFNASRRQDVWDNFVRAVPECASLVSSNDTFGCLRNASSTEILAAWNVSLSLANEQFPWVPVIDGSEGLIPALPSELYTAGAFPRVPFIAGTNLDEGAACLKCLEQY